MIMGINAVSADNLDNVKDISEEVSFNVETISVSDNVVTTNGAVNSIDEYNGNSYYDIVDENQVTYYNPICAAVKNAVDGSNIYITNELDVTDGIVIDSSNYGDYFNDDGNLISGTVDSGSSVFLSGVFDSKDFVIDVPLNIVGMDDVSINSGTVKLLSGASGSNVSNLVIMNDNVDYAPGIFLVGASYCNIFDNNIYCAGVSSFTIALNPGSNYNNITNNVLKSGTVAVQGSSKCSSGLVVGGSHYNYIANNYVEVDDANGIYLSQYGSGDFEGGLSNYNVIFNNTVKCAIVPTSWNYAVQMMGSNNRAISNTVIGCYRGISATGVNVTVIGNNLINITGINFANGQLEGGDYAIIAGNNATIINNTLTNCFVKAGIKVGSNSIVSGNDVDITGSGYGIDADGNDVTIINNNITTIDGAVIYQMGNYSGLYVDNNRLISESGVGILAERQSLRKYPSDVTIVNNYINTTNEYAINIGDVDKDSYEVRNNNVGTSKILTPSGEIISNPDFNFNGTVYYITPDNYDTFFDSNGNLINVDVKDRDILNFEGTFSNIKPIISKSLQITGQNPIFYNTTFVVTSDGVWIENTTIINYNQINGWGIYASNMEHLMISNNKINVTDDNAAYAVYLYYVANAQVENNQLISSGDYLTYTVLFYGVEDSYIGANTILTSGSGEIHAYESSKCIDGEHDVPEIFRTYGILLLYTSGTNVSDNDVEVTSKLTEEKATIDGSLSTNSIVGIDAYFSSNNNNFENNYVYVHGNDNYVYGMGVLGAETGTGSSTSENNKFKDNIIVISSPYFGTGIIVGYNSKNTSISDNQINIDSTSLGYGITLESSSASFITDNSMDIDSQVIYGIELFVSDKNMISGNIIDGNGNYVYGIAGYHSSYNVIQSNNIHTVGDESVDIDFVNWDALGTGNGGILFKSNSSNNVISFNSINSTVNNAVILNNSCNNNNVTDNFLIGEFGHSNDGVTDLGDNNYIADNYAFFFDGALLVDVSSDYLGEIILTANSGIENDDETIVKFYIGDKLIGSAKTSSGVATYRFQLNSSFAVGLYDIRATFEHDDYKDGEANANLTINKGNLVLDTQNITGQKGSTVPIKVTVRDEFGNLVEGIEVEFYRGNQYIGRSTSDSNGVATLNYEIPPSLSGDSFELRMVALNSTNYIGSSVLSTLTCDSIQISSENLVLYYKNGSSFIVQVMDSLGNPITNDVVSFTINGQTYNRTIDENGFARIAINLNPGIYEIVTTYDGDSGSLSIVNNITILPTVIGSDVVKYFRNGTQYNVKLVDGQGNILAGQAVTFNINGVFYERVSNEKGIATLSINLNPGEYIITAEDPNNGLLVSNIISVLPILDSSDLVKYFRNESQYNVVVLDGTGAPLANKVVTFNINGVFYERVSNEKGIATLSINLNPGDYIITATYNGCSVSNDITVLPVLVDNSDLVKYFRNNSQYSVRIVDGTGKYLSNATVTFNINGVFYERVSNEKGIATLSINLNPGDYIITATYNGCSVSNDITVLSTLQADDLTKHFNTPASFDCALVDGSGNPNVNKTIIYNINGVFYERITDENGVAHLNINLNPGEYIITSMYDGLAISNKVTVIN